MGAAEQPQPPANNTLREYILLEDCVGGTLPEFWHEVLFQLNYVWTKTLHLSLIATVAMFFCACRLVGRHAREYPLELIEWLLDGQAGLPHFDDTDNQPISFFAYVTHSKKSLGIQMPQKVF